MRFRGVKYRFFARLNAPEVFENKRIVLIEPVPKGVKAFWRPDTEQLERVIFPRKWRLGIDKAKVKK